MVIPLTTHRRLVWLSAIVVAVALAVALVFGVLTTLEAEGIPASAHRQPDPSDPASNSSGRAGGGDPSTRLRRIPQHRHAQFADSTWLRRALPRDRTQHLCPAIFVIHASAAGIAGRRPADLEASGTASVPWTLETGARPDQLYTPRCHPAHRQRLHASSSDPRTRRNLEAFPRAVGCPDPAFPACPLSCRRVRR